MAVANEFDLIYGFSIDYYMHCVLQGVMKTY